MEELHSSQATPDEWATRWINALPGGDHSVRAAFASGLRRSARYVEAYLRQKMLETELRALDPDKRIDAQALVSRARERLRSNSGKVIGTGVLR